MGITTNVFLLASPLGIQSYRSYSLAEKGQIDVRMGLTPPNCRSIRLMHLTTYCCCIPFKAWAKCKPVVVLPHRSRFTAKIYPPKRRKGWFSRVVCRVRNLPFLSFILSLKESRRTKRAKRGCSTKNIRIPLIHSLML